MTGRPALRKFALIVHIVASVGWIGAVIAYLALVAAARTGQDAGAIRAALIAMEPMMRFALIPLAFGSLITGLIMALGTPWGLFRHYWVLAKLLLTVFSLLVMLTQLEPISYTARLALAADSGTGADAGADLGALAGISLFFHPGLGLLVLLAIMTISVYKPRGMTPYGWRKQQEKRKESRS